MTVIVDHELLAEITEMNAKRAAMAGKAIAAFMKETGTDLEDVLCDLLCDLMHWAALNKFNFSDVMDRAVDHYIAEQLEL